MFLIEAGHDANPAVAMAINLLGEKGVPHQVRQFVRRYRSVTMTPHERESFANVLQARRVLLEGALLSLDGADVREGAVLSAHALCETGKPKRALRLQIGGARAQLTQIVAARDRVRSEVRSSDALVEAAVELPEAEPLKEGAGGGKPHPRVVHLQNKLNALGHRVAADGVFGPIMTEAVKDFQARVGLESSGEVDERTSDALRQGGKVVVAGVNVPANPALFPGPASPPLAPIGVGDPNKETGNSAGQVAQPVAKQPAQKDVGPPKKPGKSVSLKVQLGESDVLTSYTSRSDKERRDAARLGEARHGKAFSDADSLTESAQTAALSVTPAPIGRGGTNWVTKSKPGNAGQLPPYIQNVRNAIMRGGKDESEATAIAVGRVEDWAVGEGGVGPEVKAAAAKAVVEWTKLKGAAHAKSDAKDLSEMWSDAARVASAAVRTTGAPKSSGVHASSPHASMYRAAGHIEAARDPFIAHEAAHAHIVKARASLPSAHPAQSHLAHAALSAAAHSRDAMNGHLQSARASMGLQEADSVSDFPGTLACPTCGAKTKMPAKVCQRGHSLAKARLEHALVASLEFQRDLDLLLRECPELEESWAEFDAQRHKQAWHGLVKAGPMPGSYKDSPGRGPTGKLRNFMTMSPVKLSATLDALAVHGEDHEAHFAAMHAAGEKLGLKIEGPQKQLMSESATELLEMWSVASRAASLIARRAEMKDKAGEHVRAAAELTGMATPGTLEKRDPDVRGVQDAVRGRLHGLGNGKSISVPVPEGEIKVTHAGHSGPMSVMHVAGGGHHPDADLRRGDRNVVGKGSAAREIAERVVSAHRADQAHSDEISHQVSSAKPGESVHMPSLDGHHATLTPNADGSVRVAHDRPDVPDSTHSSASDAVAHAKSAARAAGSRFMPEGHSDPLAVKAPASGAGELAGHAARHSHRGAVDAVGEFVERNLGVEQLDAPKEFLRDQIGAVSGGVFGVGGEHAGHAVANGLASIAPHVAAHVAAMAPHVSAVHHALTMVQARVEDARAVLAEAEASGDGDRIVRARARVRALEVRLEEANANVEQVRGADNGRPVEEAAAGVSAPVAELAARPVEAETVTEAMAMQCPSCGMSVAADARACQRGHRIEESWSDVARKASALARHSDLKGRLGSMGALNAPMTLRPNEPNKMGPPVDDHGGHDWHYASTVPDGHTFKKAVETGPGAGKYKDWPKGTLYHFGVKGKGFGGSVWHHHGEDGTVTKAGSETELRGKLA